MITFFTPRKMLGSLCLLVAVLLWIPSGDVVDMIIRNKEILFGKYSQGHFGILLVLNLLLLGLSALCFSSLRSTGEMVGVGVMVLVSTAASVFVLVVGSGWAVKPRYVQQVVTQQTGEKQIRGLVRHRPPREYYELEQVDKPEQARSYPDAPAGYPTFKVTLSTDQHGFRNKEVDGKLLEHYPIVAVGDSFAAGSHVSDEQAWTSLLSASLRVPIYNLGVSGSDPGNYYNNFVLLGKQFKPKQVLFMIYEGNDFKKITPIATMGSSTGKDARDKKSSLNISQLAEASPVTKGLRRLSAEVLQKIGHDRPVPDYQEKVGFMPLAYSGEGFTHYYAFEPKRLSYLNEDKEVFRASDSWQKIADIMQRLVEQGRSEGYEMVFLYAPSTPHVIMPLMKEKIPAVQLRNFLAYEDDGLPPADMLKQQIFERMDNEQQVFEEHCASRHYRCLALTPALQQAASEGKQVYFSYDQHWTPDGNRVVAEAIRDFLR